MILPYYKSVNRDYTLLNGDSLEILKNFEFEFDMIFADPPYFLSGNGKTISSGKVVSVNKGEWDKPRPIEEIDSFNREWLSLCWDKLRDGGTIWVSGTYHNIFSVGRIMQELGYKILNIVTWQKTNPPQNIYNTHFQYASEHIIWAKKGNSRHTINVEEIKELNNGQMLEDVWKLPAVQNWEKILGRHTTQKPLPLLSRIILTSTKPNDWILDPFAGSGTTGLAASLFGRRFCGIEKDEKYCELAKIRREDISSHDISSAFIDKIYSVIDIGVNSSCMVNEDINYKYNRELPF